MSPSVTPHVKIELEMKIKQSSAASPQLTGWVYWQRDPARSPDCWTKAFAVLDNAFLWLFQREESAPQNVLVQLAVADVDDAEGERLLCVIDPNGEELRICLSDSATFETWSVRLKDAAYHTAAFFRSSGLDVRDLPRWSNYRGTLESSFQADKM